MPLSPCTRFHLFHPLPLPTARCSAERLAGFPDPLPAAVWPLAPAEPLGALLPGSRVTLPTVSVAHPRDLSVLSWTWDVDIPDIFTFFF